MSVIKEASITMVNFLSKKAATSRVHIASLLLALASLGPASAHPIPLDEDITAADAALDFRQARHIDVSSIHSSIERGADEEALQSCRSFKMSERQVKIFFKQAQAITATEFDHTYDWAPCNVSGKATIDGLAFEWKVSASGVARAWRKPAETHDLILACADDCQRKVFGKKR